MPKCNFCDAKLYIKVKRLRRPLAAPLTEAAALQDRLVDLTGEDYILIPAKFCPMCGRDKEASDE